MDIDLLMREMSKERPIFSGKDDFANSLKRVIEQIYTDAYVDRDIDIGFGNNTKQDLRVVKSDLTHYFKLSYKQKKLDVYMEGIRYELKNHGANDHGRYDFLQATQTAERLVASRPGNVVAYTILLTNDHLYWEGIKRSNPIDEEFRIHEGVRKSGRMMWSSEAGIGSTNKRSEAILLHNQYLMNWHNYSAIPGVNNGNFRYVYNAVSRQVATLNKPSQEIDIYNDIKPIETVELSVTQATRSNKNRK